MPLSENLTKFSTASPVIASYDFVDFSEGTGIVILYGSVKQDDSGITYLLTRNTEANSSIIESWFLNISPTNTQLADYDFDLSPFNMAQTIEGTMVISIPFFSVGNGSPRTSESFFIIKLRKWDGSTETEIASVTTKTHLWDVGDTGLTDGHQFLTSMTIPRTHFRVGDTLRITIEFWSKRGANDVVSCGFAHDPSNNNTTFVFPNSESAPQTSQLKFFVPFRIEQR